jgi:protein involved in polysaccharide export with SLBB domain
MYPWRRLLAMLAACLLLMITGCQLVDCTAPLAQAPVTSERESLRELLSSGRSKDMYAPSLPPPVQTETEAEEVVNNQSIYAVDPQAAMLLYDTDAVAADDCRQQREWDSLEPPRELSMVSLPTYRIEPPDLIKLEVIRLVPRSPCHIELSDRLLINVRGTPKDDLPIKNVFVVESDGKVTLGPSYGKVLVSGLSLEEARKQITQSLKKVLINPEVAVQCLDNDPHPQVAVQSTPSENDPNLSNVYRVGADGTVTLNRFGAVHVAGKTVTEARHALEQQLARYYDSPQVGLEVVGNSSKTYYVIIGASSPEWIGGGLLMNYTHEMQIESDWEYRKNQVWTRLVTSENGVEVGRTPWTLESESTLEWSSFVQGEMRSSSKGRAAFMITGNETVLDVIGQISEIHELPPLSSSKIWIARPAPAGFGREQILPVDWDAVARGGLTDTNYQILPGDRIYITGDNLTRLNNFVGKVTAPIERFLGISSLGINTINAAEITGREYNKQRRN